jgi:hypothetical protein
MTERNTWCNGNKVYSSEILSLITHERNNNKEN